MECHHCLMWRKYFPLITLFFLVIQSPLVSEEDHSYQYSNETLDFEIRSNSPWNIGATYETVPASLKNVFPKTKKSENDPPHLLGQFGNAPAFVMMVVEDVDLSMEVYTDYYKNNYKSKGLSVHSIRFDKERNIMEWDFEGKVNNFPIHYFDIVRFYNNRIYRITFWTLSSLKDKYESTFRDLADRIHVKSNGEALFNPDEGYEKSLISMELELPPERPEQKQEIVRKTDLPGATFFTVPGKTNRVHIMGSVHVGKPDFYPFHPHIEEAFTHSPNLVVEADIRKLSEGENITKIRTMSLLPEDKKLSEVLSPELYSRLTDVIEGYGLKMEAYDRLQPWVMLGVLQNLAAVSEGYLSEEGVDRHFLDASGNRKVLEMEGAMKQLDFLHNLDGESLLSYTLISHKTSGYQINKLIEAWKKGDLENLTMLNESPEFSDPENPVVKMHKTLIIERNHEMAGLILKYLESEEDYFVVVGAAHLGGPKGIIELLKKKGYSPEQFTGKNSSDQEIEESVK